MGVSLACGRVCQRNAAEAFCQKRNAAEAFCQKRNAAEAFCQKRNAAEAFCQKRGWLGCVTGEVTAET
jgi:hypothetical protein